jgi:hypothetical protein
MADESNMAAKTFFSDYNFKNDDSSKILLLLYFLTKNTTFVEQIFFYKNSKWRINQNGDFSDHSFKML